MSDKTSADKTGADTKASGELVVLSRYGIHARPAALLVKTASMFQSEITIRKNEMKVSCKSIMGLMTLEAGFGSKVTVAAEGEDARQAFNAIQKLFEQKFYEN